MELRKTLWEKALVYHWQNKFSCLNYQSIMVKDRENIRYCVYFFHCYHTFIFILVLSEAFGQNFYSNKEPKKCLFICFVQVVFWCEKLWLVFRWPIFPFLFCFGIDKVFSVFQIWFLASVYKKDNILSGCDNLWQKG